MTTAMAVGVFAGVLVLVGWAVGWTPLQQLRTMPTPGEFDRSVTPMDTMLSPGDAGSSSLMQPPTPSAQPTNLSWPVQLVRQDLAERLGVAFNSIEVVQVEDVVWPDTCLGLPAPELCARGETPGFRATLVALGQEYTYHTDKSETFRFAGPGDVPKRPQGANHRKDEEETSGESWR